MSVQINIDWHQQSEYALDLKKDCAARNQAVALHSRYTGGMTMNVYQASYTELMTRRFVKQQLAVIALITAAVLMLISNPTLAQDPY